MTDILVPKLPFGNSGPRNSVSPNHRESESHDEKQSFAVRRSQTEFGNEVKFQPLLFPLALQHAGARLRQTSPALSCLDRLILQRFQIREIGEAKGAADRVQVKIEIVAPL